MKDKSQINQSLQRREAGDTRKSQNCCVSSGTIKLDETTEEKEPKE